MGGRGSHAENNNQQITMEELLFREEIRAIREQAERSRVAYLSENSDCACGGAAVNYKHPLRKRCACCRQYTLPAYSIYTECSVCGWIDDPAQNENPDMTTGKNPISLAEAQERWSVIYSQTP